MKQRQATLGSHVTEILANVWQHQASPWQYLLWIWEKAACPLPAFNIKARESDQCWTSWIFSAHCSNVSRPRMNHMLLQFRYAKLGQSYCFSPDRTTGWAANRLLAPSDSLISLELSSIRSYYCFIYLLFTIMLRIVVGLTNVEGQTT